MVQKGTNDRKVQHTGEGRGGERKRKKQNWSWELSILFVEEDRGRSLLPSLLHLLCLLLMGELQGDGKREGEAGEEVERMRRPLLVAWHVREKLKI